MIGSVPRVPLYLALAGTLPFIAGAILTLFPQLVSALGLPMFTARLAGGAVLLTYGTIILSFMAGVLWGFATLASDARAPLAYGLSVIPAILVFFAGLYGYFAPLIGLGQPSLIPLLIGFPALLILDYLYARTGLAPDWWMPMRSLITVIVTICLFVGEVST